MAAFSVTKKAETELDEIWLYIARQSYSTETAARITDSIHARFWLLAGNPFMGRTREDLRGGLRSFVVGQYVIVYRVGKADDGDDMVLILHVVHGSRDLLAIIQADEFA
jgi:toxin ParE1/3/4